MISHVISAWSVTWPVHGSYVIIVWSATLAVPDSHVISAWSVTCNPLASWCGEPTHWKRPWCWERLEAKGESNRGWDGWMASLNQWMWVWASSGRQWKTGKPDMLLHGVEKSRARLSDWTMTTIITIKRLIYASHFAKCFMSTNIILNYDEKYYYFPIFQMTKQR